MSDVRPGSFRRKRYVDGERHGGIGSDSGTIG